MPLKNPLALSMFAASALSLAGCATHESETREARAAWYAGNFGAAAQKFAEIEVCKESGDDAVVWELESGAAWRGAGDIEKSRLCFEKAEKKFAYYEARPDVSITQETAAVFTNQSYLPYRGYWYDKIMESVYQSLNNLEKRDFEKTAVSLKRLEFYQQNAAQENQKRIDKEAQSIKDANKKDANSYNASSTLSNSAAQAKLKAIYGDSYSPDLSLKAKASYVNPFGYWLSGVFFLNAAEDSSDINRAADFFRFCLETLGGDCAPLIEDIAVAEKLAGGPVQSPPPVTYVVYETGSAPIRKQVRIDLPIFIVSQDVPYVGMNFPYLEKQDSYRRDLIITYAQGAAQLATIADMDKIISQEFANDLPLTIIKTVISAGVKAGAQYGLMQAARQSNNDWLQIGVMIAGTVYQASMNDADLRTWTTLPKQIRIARFATPQDGLVSVDGQSIKVEAGKTNIIFAKRTSANAALYLRTFTF